jgi:colanic acid/amylovoran biosynthesis glycosyltransferase
MSLMKSGPRPRLAIVGDGPLRTELEAQANILGLADDVDFLGSLPEADTLLEISSSDVLVLPSFMEGLPIVLMEALGLGVPVVATRVAGIPELVEEGRTGLLFSPSNWIELAEALDRLVADPTLRRRLGKTGPARIAEAFDVRDSAAKLRDLFRTGGPSGAIPPEPLSSPAPRTSEFSTKHTEAVAQEPQR